MSSARTINFSLRQNKGIERAITFDALRQAELFIGQDPIFVGLGSLWFRDFQIAHRLFRFDKMISIESDDTIFSRATFNKPYACIDVVKGDTSEVIPRLLDREDLGMRPWVIWLDYDSSLDDSRIYELRQLAESLAAGSVLLTTFNARPGAYAKDTERRRGALIDLFGADIIGSELSDSSFNSPGLMHTLAQATLDYLLSASVESGRIEIFIPGIKLLYRDTARMVTVGGFFPDASQSEACKSIVSGPSWLGLDDRIIEAEPLTIREINALSQLLPNDSLSPEDVSALFDISREQLDFFKRHYLRYPLYAEIV